MSFDIGSIQGLGATEATTVPAARTNPAAATPPAVATDAVKVDTNMIPPSPPSEVLDAMGVAAAAHEQLERSGRGLSFNIDPATGKVIVSVHDVHGNLLFTVPASKALDVASGGSLDG